MPSPTETILTTAGLPSEDVTKITTLSEEDQKTFDPTPYAEKIKANYQTQFKNDPTFFNDIKLENLTPEVRKQIESGQYARATNIAKEKLAKALGFTEDQIKDLQTEDYKSLDFYVPAIAERYAKTKAGDKQLQADLIEERKKNEGYLGLEEKLKAKYEGETNLKITEVIKNAALISELSTIPNLKVKPSTLAREANEILTSKYAFERVSDYSVELRQKANPTMKVLKGQTSQELTLKDALTEIAIAEGWIEADKGDGKGSGKIPIVPGKDGTLQMVPPHLQDKFKKKIAEEAQM